jgi:hypothetical protein
MPVILRVRVSRFVADRRTIAATQERFLKLCAPDVYVE